MRMIENVYAFLLLYEKHQSINAFEFWLGRLKTFEHIVPYLLFFFSLFSLSLVRLWYDVCALSYPFDGMYCLITSSQIHSNLTCTILTQQQHFLCGPKQFFCFPADLHLSLFWFQVYRLVFSFPFFSFVRFFFSSSSFNKCSQIESIWKPHNNNNSNNNKTRFFNRKSESKPIYNFPKMYDTNIRMFKQTIREKKSRIK